jgi:hypothetical protein
MGYTGPAFISGATTDGWIAEVLAGAKLGANQSRPRFGVQIGASGPTGFLAVHLTSVADRLNEAVRTVHLNRRLSVDYVGLRWQNRRSQRGPSSGELPGTGPT